MNSSSVSHPVHIILRGKQTTPEGITDQNEITEEGTFYRRNDVNYVVTPTARYRFNHRYLEVVKGGDITTKMHFEAGKKHTTLYDTSFGSFNFTFITSMYSFSEKDSKITIESSYEIEDRNVKISTNAVTIIISQS